MGNDWEILEQTEMVCHDRAANMLAIYNVENFPSHMIPGPCINHILHCTIKVRYTVLHCTVMHCTVLHCTALCSVVQHSAVQ
jgi:hypothetical protein